MHLSRRFFLQSSGALAAYLGITPFDVLSRASAGSVLLQPVRAKKTLVVIFLRGGADGLNLVIPHADPHYAKLRRSIAVPGPASNDDFRAIDLDGFFGLHPRLAALKPAFDAGLAIAAHAVGYDRNTRSHFEEQDVWETGVIGNTINSDGWLNRHLATSEGHGPIRAIAVGDALPRILHGDAPAYAIRGLDDLSLKTGRTDPARLAAALEHAYCIGPGQARTDAQDLLAQTARTTLDGMEQLKGIASQPYRPAVPYPESGLARRLMEVARLIKAEVGVEVAEVDLGGWDTHNQQGYQGQGPFGALVQELGDATAAFLADLGGRADDVVVVTLTDFGRTAGENGTNGTDHGWANCMLVAGGPVQAASRAADQTRSPRKVVTRWPGLAPDQLHEGRDLLHTTDFRDVLAELVEMHLGNGNLKTVLPGHEFNPVGLIA